MAQLFCDQLEFANVIIMNKMDLMDDEGRARLRAILRRFNPGAELVEATWGRVDPKRILGTGLFDLAKAEQHPDWLKEGTITFRRPRPGTTSFTLRAGRGTPTHAKVSLLLQEDRPPKSSLLLNG